MNEQSSQRTRRPSRGPRAARFLAPFPRTAILVAAIWLLTAFCPPGPAAAPPTDEYQIKAAFLYHFAKFIEWPPSTLPKDNTPLLFAILSQDASPYWTAAIENQTVRGHAIVVRHLRALEELNEQYHLVFIHYSMAQDAGRIVQRLKNLPVLIVGDEIGWGARGGAINFIKIDKKIHFEVNLAAARNSGLKISSEMLKLARSVHTGNETP